MKKFKILFLLFLILTSLLYAQTVKSTGTGFFVSENGVIVTSAHVIEGSSIIKVKIADKEYDARVIEKNVETDLAILKIDYNNTHHFKISDFNAASLGNKIYVLGFPLSNILGSDIRLTDGIISARSGINSNPTFFQISAPVQPGNSGGPILNSNFEVIGVAAAKLNEMATLFSVGVIPQNINFGIKSEYIKPLLKDTPPGSGNVKNLNDAENATVYIICYEIREQTVPGINIINNTGYVVHYLFFSPSSSDTWGSDRLGPGVLRNNEAFNISSALLNVSSNYDIRLVDKDGDSYTKKNVRIYLNQNINFTFSDLDPKPQSPNASNSNSASFRIVNKTGYTIYFAYVSPVTSRSWDEDILGRDVLPNGQTFNVRLPTPLSVRNRYDIRLKDSEGDTYTKSNVLIVPNMTIEFTMRDLD